MHRRRRVHRRCWQGSSVFKILIFWIKHGAVGVYTQNPLHCSGGRDTNRFFAEMELKVPVQRTNSETEKVFFMDARILPTTVCHDISRNRKTVVFSMPSLFVHFFYNYNYSAKTSIGQQKAMPPEPIIRMADIRNVTDGIGKNSQII